MSKTASINMRVNPEVKREAESVFSQLGMTVTEAINIFLHKAILEGGLPFDVRQPRYNKETEEAIEEARAIMRGDLDAPIYKSTEDAFAFLNEKTSSSARRSKSNSKRKS